MEPASHSSSGDDPYRVLEGHLRESYGRVVYSHKTHEKCADTLLSRNASIKLGQMVLSALTTAGFVSTFFSATSGVGKAVGFSLSLALLVLNAYTKDYDLGEMAQKHRQAAADLWVIRERYLALLTDLASGGRAIAEVIEERDQLVKGLHAIYAAAPSTNAGAYRDAQRALQSSGDMTFSDSEIDAFLPTELRRAHRSTDRRE